MAHTFCICRIWMYEVVWRGYQPQPWHYGIIFTPQVTLSPQMWDQLGRCNSISIRVHSFALETAYQWLKHFVYVYYGCIKWSEVDISLNHDWGYGIISTPQVTLNTQIWRQIGRCNGIRVKTYSLEKAYQWLKIFVYVFMDLWSGLRWISASNTT